MRSIWKGHIQFSLVTIPVRIYTAFDSGKKISFNLLSKEGHNPVGYDKKDKVTGKSLDNEDIVKGYEYGEGQYVIIDKEDLEKAKVKSTKVIEIEGFVDKEEVPAVLYDSPYFIGPESEVAAKNYELLVETLRQTGKIGVGKVALRDRENPVLIAPQNDGMMLYKLRYPNELRNFQDVPYLVDVEANEEQLNLAKTLVESMSANFADLEFEDKYYDKLKEIIEAKIEGKEVVTVSDEEPETVDIMTALKTSIESAKKPMEKAKGSKKDEKKSAKGKSKTG